MSLENEIEKWCLLCGNNDSAEVKYEQNFSEEELNADVFSARRSNNHYHYRILECKKCSSVFSSPILPDNKIQELYSASKQNYDNETEYIAKSYLRYLTENKKLFNSLDSALEIGCGNGFFLTSLKEFGFKNVQGIEPSSEAVAKSGVWKSSIFNGFIEDATYLPGSFDLICSFQTLDHLSKPLEVLTKCKELLKPGGVLYLIVHNEKALQARLFGETSPIYDVEHIYLFNRVTLAETCEKIGFRTEKVFDLANTYPIHYWLRMAPLPLGKQFSWILTKLGWQNKALSLKAGNIGMFARKPH